MANKRIVTRVGNIFCYEVEGKSKRYFQYISNDWTQLNSSVIRVFKKRWNTADNPKIEEIITDEIGFYAQAILRAGIENAGWYKVGTSTNLGLEKLNHIYFAQTFDEPGIHTNPSCAIWHVNQEMIPITPIPKNVLNAMEWGVVVAYSQINNRIRLGYYTTTDSVYNLIPRRPSPETKSYVRIPKDDKTVYLEFLGETPLREVVKKDGRIIGLTPEEPESDGERFARDKFTDYVFMYPNFITSEEFEELWMKAQI